MSILPAEGYDALCRDSAVDGVGLSRENQLLPGVRLIEYDHPVSTVGIPVHLVCQSGGGITAGSHPDGTRAYDLGTMRYVVVMGVRLYLDVIRRGDGNRAPAGGAGTVGLGIWPVPVIQHQVPEGDSPAVPGKGAEEYVLEIMDQAACETVVPGTDRGFGEVYFLVRGFPHDTVKLGDVPSVIMPCRAGYV